MAETIQKNEIESPGNSSFCVHNKLNESLWVAVYYKWRILWGDAKCCVKPCLIEAGESLKLRKPKTQPKRTRLLVMTSNKEELSEKLLYKALERLTICDINANIFIEYKNNNQAFFVASTTRQYHQNKLFGRLSTSKSESQPSLRQKESGGALRRSFRRALTNTNVITPVKGKSLPDIMNIDIYEDSESSNSSTQTVNARSKLCSQEISFLTKRSILTKSAIEKLLDIEEGSLDDDIVPRIAFCGSGGGPRAMMHTVGALQGLSDTGIEECLTYVGGLSGSTWALSVWQSLHVSADDLAKNICEKLDSGPMIRITPPMLAELKEIFLSKLSYRDSKFNIITDAYAAMLAVYLLRDTSPAAGCMTLTHMGHNANLIEADYPMPIFVCATQEPNNEFEWFEFTPYTVGCAQYDCFIPTNLFGRKYTKGELKYPDEDPQEIKLACLLATFACAYCAPWRMVSDEFFSGFEKQPRGLLAENIYGMKGNIADLLLKMKLSEDHALEPPLFRNFMYGVKRSPIRNQRYIPLVDAGMDFNLPFPPLLDPLRGVDIIIAANSSKTPGIAENHSLKGIQRYAEQRGLKFPHIDYDNEQETGLIFEQPFSVFTDPNGDPECPTVVYLPLCKNPKFSETFCPQESARDGYCQTFNFDIAPEQFNELTGLARFNVMAALDSIKAAILTKIEQKKIKKYM